MKWSTIVLLSIFHNYSIQLCSFMFLFEIHWLIKSNPPFPLPSLPLFSIPSNPPNRSLSSMIPFACWGLYPPPTSDTMAYFRSIVFPFFSNKQAQWRWPTPIQQWWSMHRPNCFDYWVQTLSNRLERQRWTPYLCRRGTRILRCTYSTIDNKLHRDILTHPSVDY